MRNKKGTSQEQRKQKEENNKQQKHIGVFSIQLIITILIIFRCLRQRWQEQEQNLE